MFENPGEKIKKIAVVLFFLSAIAGVFILISGYSMYMEDKEYIKYADEIGYPSLYAAAHSALMGKTMMTWAIPIGVASMISSYFMYGFGELIEKATSTDKVLKEIEKKITLSPEEVKKQEIQEALKF